MQALNAHQELVPFYTEVISNCDAAREQFDQVSILVHAIYIYVTCDIFF